MKLRREGRKKGRARNANNNSSNNTEKTVEAAYTYSSTLITIAQSPLCWLRCCFRLYAYFLRHFCALWKCSEWWINKCSSFLLHFGMHDNTFASFSSCDEWVWVRVCKWYVIYTPSTSPPSTMLQNVCCCTCFVCVCEFECAFCLQINAQIKSN